MAYKEIPLYNLQRTVGPGCPNKPTDVMLVQFFLQQIYAHPRGAAHGPPGPKVAITGTSDGTTAAWIKHFQDDINASGSAIRIVADGKVDRQPVQYRMTPRTHSNYTIAILNNTYRRFYKDVHDHLERHPLIPPPLKAEFIAFEPIDR
ncbi:hypothetical protein [Reyranella sp. CPCC 100927]|uniref:hypothetical protein n=1 Tax=Reyranella sp. CPCC 100927 TaxID=2599616 RepID=UPI0011B7BFE2|nr:hypothetical protein [Reyranella sp. CPCC 100927]TWS93967.1 hypothetical protein FQU96_41490 [Reyranella sp. CPCC 100927]